MHSVVVTVKYVLLGVPETIHGLWQFQKLMRTRQYFVAHVSARIVCYKYFDVCLILQWRKDNLLEMSPNATGFYAVLCIVALGGFHA